MTWERPNWIPISRWEFAKYSNFTKHTRDMLNCVSLNNVTTYDGHQCTWIVAPPRPCWVCWVLRTCTHTVHLLHVGTGKSDGSKGRMHQVGHFPLVYKTYHKPNDPLCSSGIHVGNSSPWLSLTESSKPKEVHLWSARCLGNLNVTLKTLSQTMLLTCEYLKDTPWKKHTTKQVSFMHQAYWKVDCQALDQNSDCSICKFSQSLMMT